MSIWSRYRRKAVVFGGSDEERVAKILFDTADPLDIGSTDDDEKEECNDGESED